MDEREKAQTQSEALKAAAADPAHRTGVWSALNRFLAAATRREHASEHPRERDQHS